MELMLVFLLEICLYPEVQFAEYDQQFEDPEWGYLVEPKKFGKRLDMSTSLYIQIAEWHIYSQCEIPNK